MPTLNWIGKQAVLTHHKDVPYRLLEAVPELSCGPADSGNLIVQGDNLHALKALLPRYAGQVKCIYIDPPYNTGNEGWAYNDNVNSPEIRKWLGEVVGKEGETLDRHDRWLCMMYPRLVLLKQFLREDGAIFISIDDNEVASLRSVMDEVFGARRHFFPVIGNLKAQGEEFECAEQIANHLPGVKHWVRNVERKPGSFWLQTSSDRFYPDFLTELENGTIVAVEYKGADRAASPDSIEKKRIGELWAARSNGRCRFAWIENRNWAALRAAVQS